MKKVISLILAVLFILVFVVQAVVAFAAAPPTEKSSMFAGPYTRPPKNMDEYSFSDPSIYEKIRLNLLTNGVTGISVRNESISPLVTNKVKVLEIAELDGAAITAEDFKSIIAYFPNLEILKLENCYISVVPKEIETLTSLKALYLNNNLIKSMSDIDLNKLVSLEILELNNCALTDISALFSQENLFVLKLTNNKITNEMIPAEINLPKLEQLDLSFNELTKVPENFSDLQSLKYLSVSDNKLSSVQSMYLQNIIEFDVSNNELLSTSNYFNKLKEPFWKKYSIFTDIISIIKAHNLFAK